MASFVTILATFALVSGSLGYFTFPFSLKTSLSLLLNLKPGGVVYPKYMNPPFAADSAFRIYSTTNPSEVLAGGKMKLELKGPYYYKVTIWRDNVSFMKDGEVLKYDSHRTLVIDETDSANFDESFWILNPIVTAIPSQLNSMVVDKVPFKRYVEPIVFSSVNVILDAFKERLFVKRTPRELLEGKKVELLDSLTGLADRFGLKSLVPPGPPENIFGLAHYQNATMERMSIYTGVGETRSRFGEVHQWRDQNDIAFWKGKCRKIRGTNGELYKPFVDPKKSLTVFIPQICRTFQLDPVHQELVTLGHGLLAYEFKVSDKLFQGSKRNSDNSCFCLDESSAECQLDGFALMSPCFFNAPLLFAKPNFQMVDRLFKRTVDEQVFEEPVPDVQKFWLEPITGTVLRANLSLLGTFKLQRQAFMRDMGRIQNVTYAPLFMDTEVVDVPYSVSWQLRYLQLLYFNYTLIFPSLAAAGGAVLLGRRLIRGRLGGQRVAPKRPAGEPAGKLEAPAPAQQVQHQAQRQASA